MPRKRLTDRERRRLQTRRARHGPDFDRLNAHHAAGFVQTKFNSVTGKEAADKRWKQHRLEQAQQRNLGEAE